jgi:hypothetical protein
VEIANGNLIDTHATGEENDIVALRHVEEQFSLRCITIDYPDQNSGELNTFPSSTKLEGYIHLSEALCQKILVVTGLLGPGYFTTLRDLTSNYVDYF